MPTVSAILEGALAVAEGNGDAAAVAARYQLETLTRGLNVIICLAIVTLAIWRPHFGKVAAGG